MIEPHLTADPRPADGRAVLLKSMARAVKPRKRLTVSEWADANRILPRKASSEPGRWRTSRAPFLREIMDCLSLHSPVKKVSVIKPIQFGVTEAVLNWVGYIMEYDPAPVLFVEATLDLRDRLVLQRLNPMLDDCAVLADLFDSKAKRNASNTKEIKDFPGMSEAREIRWV